ncbi:Wzz/FepE/Etk N-terminal domain-containing protein [Mesorhizobium sp. RP14(2022)]|uniref:Wzz/FepE/Etk N-terminal domain-containing protein n=1 Tax=Mesorhizobium liriopis TaxID=2953882 RepID=A0ABT1C0P8_9HYPH|nr:GNVR domain-containing protein [Mesorhizobium liriopis]MCO6048407.1 Wzz/FepE/Etk N-terminal domain-containing protein [Mesorhizobium liriopis]
MFQTEDGHKPARGGSLLSVKPSDRPAHEKRPALSPAEAAAIAERNWQDANPVSPTPQPTSVDTLPPAPPTSLAAAIAAARARPGPPPSEPGLFDRMRGWAAARAATETPSEADAAPQTPPPPPVAPAADLAPRATPIAPRPETAPRPIIEYGPIPLADASGGGTWRPLIDPVLVARHVARSKSLIFVGALLGALIGVGIAVSTPKRYEASTEILIDPRDLKLVERDLTGAGLPSEATVAIVENQVRVLTSGNVLAKVVSDLRLAEDPEFNGTRGEGGLRGLVADLRSLVSGAGPSGDPSVRRRALAMENLREKLEVSRTGKTFVIRVGAITEEPEKSASIANTMAATFLQTYGEIQSGTAGRAAEELNARLSELRKGVEDAERAVETFKAQNDLVDAQGRLISDDEILKLNDQLATARARSLELDARAASARGVDANAVLNGALPEGVSSNLVTELRAQYAAQKAEADRLAVRLGPRHPQLLAVQAQLSGAREQLEGELRRIVTSTQVEQRRAADLVAQLSARLAQLKVRQGDNSSNLVTLRELEREATSKRAVYESYLLRARETGEQQGINTANMSVISPAEPPLEALGPSRAIISLTGLILGALAGLGLAILLGAWASLRARTTEPVRTSSDTTAEVEHLRASLQSLRETVRELTEARAGRG